MTCFGFSRNPSNPRWDLLCSIILQQPPFLSKQSSNPGSLGTVFLLLLFTYEHILYNQTCENTLFQGFPYFKNIIEQSCFILEK